MPSLSSLLLTSTQGPPTRRHRCQLQLARRPNPGTTRGTPQRKAQVWRAPVSCRANSRIVMIVPSCICDDVMPYLHPSLGGRLVRYRTLARGSCHPGLHRSQLPTPSAVVEMPWRETHHSSKPPSTTVQESYFLATKFEAAACVSLRDTARGCARCRATERDDLLRHRRSGLGTCVAVVGTPRRQHRGTSKKVVV